MSYVASEYSALRRGFAWSSLLRELPTLGEALLWVATSVSSKVLFHCPINQSDRSIWTITIFSVKRSVALLYSRESVQSCGSSPNKTTRGRGGGGRMGGRRFGRVTVPRSHHSFDTSFFSLVLPLSAFLLGPVTSLLQGLQRSNRCGATVSVNGHRP